MSNYKKITEVQPDLFRLTIAHNEYFEYNQFLLLGEKTALVHTGKIKHFDGLSEMADQVLAGRPVDWIVFSHFEADECGAINKWLEKYPDCKVACGKLTELSSEDFFVRPPVILADGETIDLGGEKLTMLETPHFPHNWDAHLWYESEQKVLFSSDFCAQPGICEPITESNISEPIIQFYSKTHFMPYGPTTIDALKKLSHLDIHILAPMHGSTLLGETGVKKVLSDVSQDLEEKARV